jgi:hypothetical protein
MDVLTSAAIAAEDDRQPVRRPARIPVCCSIARGSVYEDPFDLNT